MRAGFAPTREHIACLLTCSPPPARFILTLGSWFPRVLKRRMRGISRDRAWQLFRRYSGYYVTDSTCTRLNFDTRVSLEQYFASTRAIWRFIRAMFFFLGRSRYTSFVCIFTRWSRNESSEWMDWSLRSILRKTYLLWVNGKFNIQTIDWNIVYMLMLDNHLISGKTQIHRSLLLKIDNLENILYWILKWNHSLLTLYNRHWNVYVSCFVFRSSEIHSFIVCEWFPLQLFPWSNVYNFTIKVMGEYVQRIE